LLTFEKRQQVGIDHLCIRSWQASAANAIPAQVEFSANFIDL
jgi:hypothetical protein